MDPDQDPSGYMIHVALEEQIPQYPEVFPTEPSQEQALVMSRRRVSWLCAGYWRH